LLANYDKLRDSGASTGYLDKMIVGPESWVAGHLASAIQLVRKPAQYHASADADPQVVIAGPDPAIQVPSTPKMRQRTWIAVFKPSAVR
jgi:hypothetical protein